MSEDRPIYVVDTSVLLKTTGIIPEGDEDKLTETILDLEEGAHIVVPLVVVQELSNLKRYKPSCRKAAAQLLRRIQKLMSGHSCTLEEAYKLQAPIEIREGEQWLSVLPVHKDFHECSPFRPCCNDTDGQIILATMAASMTIRGAEINGNELRGSTIMRSFDNVTLLTADGCLAIRACTLGIKTMFIN